MTNNFKNCFLFYKSHARAIPYIYKSRNRKTGIFLISAGLSILYDENIKAKRYNLLSEPHCQHESYPGYFP